MNVPFIDLSAQYALIKDRIDKEMREVFESGDFILGEKEKAFEKEFACYCGVKHAVGVNSGTDALYLALGALNIGVGDEVIIPTFTFIATALCISYTGAKPVFVDIEDQTFNIDPRRLAEAITPRTKAIIPVHLYGQAANIDEITSIAKRHRIAVVEDACQAHGALYKGRRTGSLGDVGCFSFYPTKGLGAFGDAGMIVTDSDQVNERVMMLRDYGRKERYSHQIKGYNSRLDTVQAVVLSAKLTYLDQWNSMRQAHAALYQTLLKDVHEVVCPRTQPDRTHVFQTFAVRVANRDFVLAAMKKKGVGVLIHYPIPVHLQEAYADLGYQRGDFPVSEKTAAEILSLPMFPHMSEAQIEYVCGALKESR